MRGWNERWRAIDRPQGCKRGMVTDVEEEIRGRTREKENQSLKKKKGIREKGILFFSCDSGIRLM